METVPTFEDTRQHAFDAVENLKRAYEQMEGDNQLRSVGYYSAQVALHAANMLAQDKGPLTLLGTELLEGVRSGDTARMVVAFARYSQDMNFSVDYKDA